jgi:hypothetical protein
MQNKAKLHLQVKGISNSVTYFAQYLGWTLVEEMDHAALMSIQPGSLVVLSESNSNIPANHNIPNIPDQWLDTIVHSPKSGDSFYIGITSVQSTLSSLLRHGIHNYRIEEDPGFICNLFVPVIDGYIAVYWEELFLANDEILHLYAQGSSELEQAIEGLSEEDLDAALSPDKWSIRQNVLHLVDMELITMHKLKFVLAESGRGYIGNSFSQDAWSYGLDYKIRSIGAEVELFKAVRKHIVQMCKQLPDAMDRFVVASGKHETAGRLMKMMHGHVRHHLRTITKIRQMHCNENNRIK